MWKVKLATSLGPSVGGKAVGAALPGAEKVLVYARWIALGASIAYLVLGGLNIGVNFGLKGFILGPICMAIGVFVAILEYPFVPLAKYDAFNYFCNYWYRAGLFACMVIPSFFSIVTFVAGLILLGAAGCYGYGAFKGAKGTPVTAAPATNLQEQEEGKAQQHQQQQNQQQPQQEEPQGTFGRFSTRKSKAPAPQPEISEEPPAAAVSGKSSKKSLKPSKEAKKASKFSLASQGM